MADELITIVITGNSTEAVAAAEKASAAIGTVGAAAKKSSAESVAASARMKAVGGSMMAAGRSMTRYMTVPILAVGAASVKMSLDFHRSMSLVSTQAGGSAKEVKRLSQQVLELAKNSKFSPTDLSEALFHIESVGMRGAKAMHTLNAAQKLAAVGNSNLEQTTYALVSAMETGIKGTQNLHEAIGLLNAIVGSGDMHMEELTQALSSGLLISAKQVGLTLRDAGAALDLLTARGMPATVAATRLRMTFTLMAAPTEKATKALKRIGIDSEAMAKQMQKPDGLVKAVALLKEHLHGLTKIEQTQLLAEAFGGARSGTTMMALVQNMGDLGERYKQVGKSASDFNKKLRETNADPLVRLQKAWSSVQVALIEVGDVLVPVIVPALESMAKVIGNAAQGLDHLSPGMQKLVVYGAIGAAALGPLIRIVGFYVKSLGTMMAWGDRVLAGSAAQVEANSALSASYGELSTSIATATTMQERFVATRSGLLVPAGVAAPPAGPVAATGRFSRFVGRAMTGATIAIGGQMAGSMVGGQGGGVLSDAAMGAGVGMLAGPMGAAIGGIGGALYGAISHSGEGMGAKLATAFAQGFDENLAPKVKQAIEHKDLGKLGRLQHKLRFALKAAIAAGASEADLKPLRDRLNAVGEELGHIRLPRKLLEGGMSALHSGLVVRLRDISKTFSSNLKDIDLGWQHGSASWRKATAQNLQATVAAIRSGMHKGVIETSKGHREIRRLLGELHLVRGDDPLKLASGFRASWRKAGQINEQGIESVKHKLAQMPKDSREAASNAMIGMAQALERKGELPKGSMDRLRSALVTRFGQTNKELSRNLEGGIKGMGSVLDNLGRLAEKGYGALNTIGSRELKHLITKQGNLKTTAAQDLPKAAASYKDFATEGSNALAELGGNFNSFLEAFKQKPVDFHVSARGGGHAEHKAGGGFFINSPDRRDHVHAILGGQEAVVNVHQQPYVQVGLAASAALGLQPYGSLGELFQGVTRPNHLAAGGFASKVPREVMGPDTALTPAGQRGLDMARHAGLEYLRKHAGGDRSLQAVVRNANTINAQHFPYKWGGGHQSSPAPWLVPYDCSGALSALVQHSGWSQIPTMVSSGFEGVGKPGRGKFSILANGEHVYAVIGGRAWGTSESNPGGGAGWISGYTFRPGFTVRHLPVLGEGEVGGGEVAPRGHRGAGQKQKRGFARGGFLGNSMAARIAHAVSPLRFSTGGPVPPKGGELVGASFYGGPGDPSSGTTGASGVSLPGTTSFAELAMGHALGGLPFHTKLKISHAGHSVVAEKLDIGAGGSDVAGHNRAIDLWYQTAQALGISGLAVVKVAPASGAATSSKEDVPAVFHGVKTGELHFGAIPKNPHGVQREIAKREAEMDRYHKAVEAAKGKPKVEHALLANITRLRSRLKQLRNAARLLRRKAAQRKVVRKLAGKLKKITGAERDMEGAQRSYERLSQYAEQVVALEPIQPTLPANATEAEQQSAERNYVEQLVDYIRNQETPAYGNVLGGLADWRNTVLGGESVATTLERGWEKEVRGIDHDIDSINDLTKKVAGDVADWRHKHPGKGPKDYPEWLRKEIKKEHEERARLPMLRFRDREVRKTLGEGRGYFYPGFKDALSPPPIPLEGSGTFEDMLSGIQGLHWPDYHSKLNPLPSTPEAGAFGGYIFDTQMAIRELGLKVNQAQAGIAGGGGGGGSETSDALAEAIREQNAINARKQAIETGLGDVLSGFRSEFGRNLPYVGAFADGGIVPGPAGAPGWAVVHGGESITPVGGGGDTHIYLSGDLARLIEASAPGMAKKSDQWIGRTTRRLSFAPGG